ncbi:MAG: methionine--tRNA ligase [Magnetococcales bacterium]|nr:methionine--tRNA ligase [Magnetococcales bacterium]
MSKTAYITTPIYYPSGNPHLGSAYTSTACDVWARFKRLDGFDTLFLTGTDEHGLKIQRSAEKAGMETQAYLDGINEKFRELSPIMNLSNDDFIRTTEQRHKDIATKMWQTLEKAGYIYKDKYAGWYSVSDETYYTEEQLVDGKSPDSGHPVEWVEEESYFFKMSAFEQKLLDFYEQNPNFIQPASRRNEVISFVKNGLEDVSVSRTTFNWGIPVPGDDKHVMYVWVDALTNYLSAIGWPESDKMKYWPAIHVVGKDILRFHAIIWPAMLMAAEVPLPKQVYAHGWWTSEGKKMSKSFGNVIDPKEVTETYGTDQIRYFILREISFGSDGDFSKDRLVERINSDLANSLGNLYQRVLSMVAKNVGHVPQHQNLTEADEAYIGQFNGIIGDVRQEMEALQFHKALERIWQVVYSANQYMDAQEPWVLRKTDPERMATVLRVLMESFKYITALIKPFMPEAASKFEAQLNWQVTDYKTLEDADFFSLNVESEIQKPSGVFMRVENKEAA